MSDISRLAQTLMKLDDRLADCMRCGLCQAVCPVFGVTHKEADVSRGKLALLDNLAHKIIEDPDAVEEKLNRCLLFPTLINPPETQNVQSGAEFRVSAHNCTSSVSAALTAGLSLLFYEFFITILSTTSATCSQASAHLSR